ncbi:MAG: hypothetical protein QXI89_00770 [Candidatus Anstonellales archaeon]
MNIMAETAEKIKNGFIVVDKPANLNSHEVSAYIGKWLNIKAGHAGTLDPDVTGLLIVGLGKATRMLRFLAEQEKEYICLMKLNKEKTREEIERMFKAYERDIWQTPPEKSAVAKKPRKRKVYNLKLIEIHDKLVLFKALVEKGTYMRVLCKQMNGEMLDLRRISSACINEKYAFIMQKIKHAIDNYRGGNAEELHEIIKSPEEIFSLSCIQKIYVNERAAQNILKGAPLYAPGIIWEKTEEKGKIKNGYAAVFSGDRLIAIMNVINENARKKGVVAKIERLNI